MSRGRPRAARSAIARRAARPGEEEEDKWDLTACNQIVTYQHLSLQVDTHFSAFFRVTIADKM